MDFDLIRRLIARRFATIEDVADSGLGVELDDASTMILAGTPEATIFAIVESWASMSSRGASGDTIAQTIEKARSGRGPSRETPPSDLLPYVKHRLSIEHAGAPGLSPNHVLDCVSRILDRIGSSHLDPSHAVGPESDVDEPSIERLTAFANAPNLRGLRPFDQYHLGKYFVLFFEKPPRQGAAFNIPSLFEYLTVAVVFENLSSAPLFWIGLEEGSTGKAFLCHGNLDGLHDNFGRSEELRDSGAFARKALDLIATRLSVNKNPIRLQLPAQNQSPVTAAQPILNDAVVIAIILVAIVALFLFGSYD